MGIFDRVKKIAKTAQSNLETSERYFYGKFVVLDVETTGLNPEEHRIVEMCLLSVNDGNIQEVWTSRFNPEGPVGKTEIHGVTDADVADAPLFKESLEDVLSRIQNVVLVAHNARFDLAFLRSELNRAGFNSPWLPSICTLQASNYYQPHLSRRRLSDCCEDIGVEIKDAHSANGDAIATAQLFHYYLNPKKNPTPRLEDLELIKNPANRQSKFSPRAPMNSYVRERIERAQSEKASPISNSSYKELVKLMTGCSLSDVLDGEQFANESSYLEKVIEFLSDGVITDSESLGLEAVAKIYDLTSDQIAMAHKSLLKALYIQALKDESVSASEREELANVAVSLGLAKGLITELLKEAKDLRAQSLSRNLLVLPDSWKLGEPLRVGQKVVFTGCDPEQRAHLERESKKAGVAIASKVSCKTSFLVTDGSYVGNKANDAKALGVRVVTPDEYEILLKYLQTVF